MSEERKLQVLRAIVTDYVSSQEPVGSRALVERHCLDVSPATVRNDMAALEEEGYIMQPHTSAGRIPTDKGYRLFVDRLATVKPLSHAERRAIQTFLAGAVDVDDIVLRTVRLLAQITHQVAIVQYPVSSGAKVRHIELLPLSSERGIIVLITSTGRVEQRTIEMDASDEDAIARLRNKLNEATEGKGMAAASESLGKLAEQIPPNERAQASSVIANLLELIAFEPLTKVVVGGVPNLARYGGQLELAVQPILEALEEQVVLLQLLSETAGSEDITVRIGQENTYEKLQSTSVVATGYGNPADMWASLGIVGPTRMDYPATIASVLAVARYVGRFLGEG